MRVYNYSIVIAALLNGRSSGSVESLFEQDTGPMTVDGSDNPGNGVPGAGETQQALFSWWDLNGGPQRVDSDQLSLRLTRSQTIPGVFYTDATLAHPRNSVPDSDEIFVPPPSAQQVVVQRPASLMGRLKSRLPVARLVQRSTEAVHGRSVATTCWAGRAGTGSTGRLAACRHRSIEAPVSAEAPGAGSPFRKDL